MDDRQLLDQFVRDHSQSAFRELVERHLPVVYSAARRMVRDSHLAEEVAQTVFTTLAQKAPSIRPPQVIGGWLYNTTRHFAMHAVRSEQRRREREQTAVIMQSLELGSQDDQRFTEQLEPAMEELDAEDRDALVLRYLADRAFREVGAELGISEDAARKRVNRALERLRSVLEKRGICVATVLLGTTLGSSTVAVPAGLCATITTTALAGIAVQTSAAIATTKVIAMTTLQKSIITATIAATVGTGIYEAHRVSTLQTQVQSLQEQQAPLLQQVEQLTRDRDEAVRRLALSEASPGNAELQQLLKDKAELARFLDEVRQLRTQAALAKGIQGSAIPAPGGVAGDPIPSAIEEMKQLGLAASRGDAAALQKLSDLSETAAKGRTNVNQDTHRDIRVAFDVIGEEAGKGSETALQALWNATRMKYLSGMATMALGQAAGMGNERALEPLLDPERYLLLQSTATSALKYAAENGNVKAIETLAVVAGDPKNRALWYGIAQYLQKPAAAGNATAIDTLALLGRAENKEVRKEAMLGLERAAANGQAKAVEAMRGLGYQ